MIAIPAVDLRDGACVQLVGGSYEDERVRLDDPLAVARDWARRGFRWLHVVDLDAATGVGRDNDTIIGALIRQAEGEVQVGGGIRTTERASALLEMGASRVVVGTRAIEDRDWLASLTEAFPGRIVLAADVRERRLLSHGWARVEPREVLDFVASVSALPLGGLLVTAVHREGQMTGPDLSLMRDVAGVTTLPLIASGGIASVEDLSALDACGVSAAVVGMALYTGALDADAAATQFGS